MDVNETFAPPGICIFDPHNFAPQGPVASNPPGDRSPPAPIAARGPVLPLPSGDLISLCPSHHRPPTTRHPPRQTPPCFLLANPLPKTSLHVQFPPRIRGRSGPARFSLAYPTCNLLTAPKLCGPANHSSKHGFERSHIGRCRALAKLASLVMADTRRHARGFALTGRPRMPR